MLTFIDGEVLADPAWVPGTPTPWPDWAQSEEPLAASAALLRQLHESSASFKPAHPVWKQYEHGHLLPGEIVCHGDVGPHNTVYSDGLPVALIDWETIRPNSPLVEFGVAAWHYVPLGDDEYFSRSGFSATPELPRRLRLFATAYGLVDPAAVLWSIQQAKQRSVEAMRYWPIAPRDVSSYLRLVAGQLAWLDRAWPELERGFR